MAQYICAFFPKKSAIAKGVKALAVTLEAKLAKHAGMKAEVLLEEVHPETADEYFKPKIAEFTPDSAGCPTAGEFDSDWLDSNVWNDETKKFDYTPADLPQNVNAEAPDPLLSAKVIFDLPIIERITYIAMYGAQPEEIDPEQLSNAVDMYNDPDMPDDLHILIRGMLQLPSVGAMYPASVAEIIDKIRAVLPPAETADEVTQLATKYAKKPAEREISEQSRTYEILDLEVALHVMGINPDVAKASDIRSAKDLIQKRDPAWRAWATSLRVITGILSLPRGELWELMADGHKNLKLIDDADARRDYVSNKLHGHPLLPDYQLGAAKVKTLGGGRFSIENLTANDASNVGEKAEVAGGNLTELQTHIRDLVTGKTNVVSADEMAKLLIDNKLGALFLIKQLAEDFEISGNAFSFLGVDEIHHLTLDVLESWIPDMADRVTFITERTAFYLAERSNKNTEAPASSNVSQLVPKADQMDPIPAQPEPVIKEITVTPAETVSTVTDQFEQRADAMEKELAAKEGDAAKNLDIWKRVQRTDPARTKRKDTLDGKGNVTRTVTSIRPTYQYLRATEIFGPFGIGWGVDVIEERFDRGIPLMESVTDNAGRETGKKVMRDGDGTIMTSLNHTMKITLWYNHEGSRGEITAYGHTKALYASKYGLTVEDEPSKKSLTDATTKALSSLGFSADVYLGMFDDAEYSQDNAFEHDLKSATEKADDSVRLRKELDDRFATNTATMRSAVTKNELTAIASSLTRTIGTHIKSAKAIGDMQHASYLESRLRRLEEIKAECLAKFDEVKA
ncbi:hypothetical protein [Rahnella aceris]|uniref:hypothetical protein n=1 Tax=Rahnella sp. (strain Y9602) TaxID=2703885 RepID=UPI001C25A4BF|nr:hypothetical protein [Rahnella aceris]MBU9866778.1 hypothetical protein [Rahnella aceris]